MRRWVIDTVSPTVQGAHAIVVARMVIAWFGKGRRRTVWEAAAPGDGDVGHLNVLP
jgi:hypothetical protein